MKQKARLMIFFYRIWEFLILKKGAKKYQKVHLGNLDPKIIESGKNTFKKNGIEIGL